MKTRWGLEEINQDVFCFFFKCKDQQKHQIKGLLYSKFTAVAFEHVGIFPMKQSDKVPEITKVELQYNFSAYSYLLMIKKLLKK